MRISRHELESPGRGFGAASVPRAADFAVRTGTTLALLMALVLGGGCFWRGSSESTEAQRYESQRGVVSLPHGEKAGLVMLTFREGDFDARELRLPEGAYMIDVRNENHPSDVGFFLRRPDKFGREAENHLATGGGIGPGETRRFEVELAAGYSYFYNDPITGSPSYQITVEEPLKVAVAEDDYEESEAGVASEEADETAAAPKEPAFEIIFGKRSEESTAGVEESDEESLTDAVDGTEDRPAMGKVEEPAPDSTKTADSETGEKEEEILPPDVKKLLEAYDRAQPPADGKKQRIWRSQ